MYSVESIREFQEIVWAHYRDSKRSMPWRDDPSPYKVLVSEIMLQQTQVERVKPKFIAFMEQFPTVEVLAGAPLDQVLRAWSGLGYNRRAKFLWQAAKMIRDDFNSQFPNDTKLLMGLPGVGRNTAGAIRAYAFNLPAVFIETNIRTVYFYHFFPDNTSTVSDKELSLLVEATVDPEHPREWFYALMDYGSWLKKTQGAQLEKSRHYRRQTPLKGSRREMRGRILRALSVKQLDDNSLRQDVDADERYGPALESLHREGLIEHNHHTQKWCLTGGADAR